MAKEIDVRLASPTPVAVGARTDAAARTVAEEVSGLLPGRHEVEVVSFDVQSGNPAVVVSRDGPSERGNYIIRALAHVQGIKRVLGLTVDQPAEYVADPEYQTTSAGAVAVHLRQQHHGIAIYDASETVRFDPQGRLLEVAGRSFTVGSDLTIDPTITAAAAVRLATEYLATGESADTAGVDPFGNSLAEPTIDGRGLDLQPTTVAHDKPDRSTVFDHVGLFEHAVTVSLVWFPLDGSLRLAWHLRLEVPGGAQYRFVIDANEPRVLLCKRLTRSIVARGRVVLRSGAPPSDVAMPISLTTYGAPVPPGLPAGFPDPWMIDVSTNGATVSAVNAIDGQPVIGSLSAGEVVFAAPGPNVSTDQLVLNLFALCSAMHDVLYLLGFRETDGNFQVDNHGRGGRPSDSVLATVHPAPVFGTANMSTPVDGNRPQMRMGLVNSTNRHTALDPDVVYHEYTHGLTNRLVGGPMNDTALDADQSAGMGEGWSDFFACTLLNKTVVGDWVVNRPSGIRSHPYTDSFPNTYADLGSGAFSEVHSIGELWCSTLMSLGRRIGAWVAAQVVVDALKLTSANPSFLAARDAILLAADQLAVSRGDTPAARAAFIADIWTTFAHAGMGPGAATNGATLQGIVADFTTPHPTGASTVTATATPGLAIPDANPQGIRSSIALAGAGSVSALAVTVAVAHPFRGDLSITLAAPDGAQAVLHDRAGGSADDVRTTYESGTSVALAALLGQSVAGSWTLVVADMATSDVGVLESWTIEAMVGAPTTALLFEATPGIAIPDNDPSSAVSVIVVDANGAAQAVEFDVDITHTFIGDLEVSLSGPTGKRVMVHKRRGGSDDNLITTYSSSAAGPLTPFVGLDVHGEWTLKVTDRAARDVGKLNRWALRLRT